MALCLSPAFAQIFDDAQRSVSGKEKSMRELLEVSHTAEGFREVLGALDRALCFPKLEASVRRVLDYVACIPEVLFAAGSAPAAKKAADVLFKFGVNRCRAADRSVRARSVLFLKQLLGKTPDDLELDDATFAAIEACLLERLCDRAPQVRAFACSAVLRLQTPSDDGAEHALTTELRRMLREDPSKEVRLAAVRSIALSKATLPVVLERVKDVREEVRLAAVERLAAEADVRALAPAQRAALAEGVLRDRSDKVRGAGVQLLLFRWLPRLKYSLERLLALMDPLSNAKACATVLHALFRFAYECNDGEVEGLAEGACATLGIDLGEALSVATKAVSAVRRSKFCVDPECADAESMEFGPEAAFFLFQKLRFLRASRSAALSPAKRAALLEAAAPTTKSLSVCLQDCGAADEAGAFALESLLRCVPMLDLQEEAGRRALLEALLVFAADDNTPRELLQSVLLALSAVCDSEEDLVDLVHTLFSDLGCSAPSRASLARRAALVAALFERVRPPLCRVREVQLLLRSAANDLVRWLLEERPAASAEEEELEAELQEQCVLGIGRWCVVDCAARRGAQEAEQAEEGLLSAEDMALLLLRAANSAELGAGVRLTALHACVDLSMVQRGCGVAAIAGREGELTLMDAVLEHCASERVCVARMGRELGMRMLHWRLVGDAVLRRALLADLVYFYFEDASVENLTAARNAAAATNDAAAELERGGRTRLQQLLNVFFEGYDRETKAAFRDCVPDVLQTAAAGITQIAANGAAAAGDLLLPVGVGKRAVQFVYEKVAGRADAADGVALGVLFFLMSNAREQEHKALFTNIARALATLPPPAPESAELHLRAAHKARDHLADIGDRSGATAIAKYIAACEAAGRDRPAAPEAQGERDVCPDAWRDVLFNEACAPVV